MNPKKENSKITKVEEPTSTYETSKIKFKGIDKTTFDFDEEFKNGYTPEQLKEEMHKRINAYPWEK